MTFDNILVAGYGAMASAMVEGWIAAGIPPGTFTIYNPRKKSAPEGTHFTLDVPATPFDAVLLGFKPHMLADVAPDLAPSVSGQTVILSVLAGIELATLKQAFPKAGGVVRFMPNLAIALGKSPNALLADGLTERQREQVTALGRAGGTAEWLEDESQFDLVTALAGSGPGFVYRFIDALAAGAAAQGLSQEQAQRLAVQMVEGAAALAASSQLSPGELAARVASPGGMTQKGLDVLDQNDALNELVENCLVAARNRGRQMAEEARAKE
ncbi:pyrroline-5-carboxylate reductase [Altererythrobacter aurantiacus]|uniref:Pyrroline-5-carboxylate reductase n=1 Tax=Parapontixanthobacter aurantiacus TaxID=1463599 RepID=A0A844ZBQ6_9SPHN|nr:pyrroline-5-carboxylate reductase [Parapontixanthobacter aurantiacus]MXO84712.1 pyrroline-5-carboxylate reductase [Parapontixanthobacter aurantiacus]